MTLCAMVAVCAGAFGAGEIAPMQLEDGSQVVFSKNGTWSVQRDGEMLAAGCGAAVWVENDYRTQVKAEEVEQIAATAGEVAFRGSLTVGGVTVQFDQSIRHLNHGLVIRYGFEGFQLPMARSLAVVLNLPLDEYRGLPFVSAGKEAGNFPAEAAKEPRLVTRPAERLVVATSDSVRLLVEAPRPQLMVLQDARTWGLETYQLLMVPDETPGRREMTFFLAFTGIEHGPRLASLAQNGRQVGVYDPFELTLDFWGEYANPYDPEDVEVACRFESPSGRSTTIAGFLYQGFARSDELGKEILTSQGSPVWKVRFAPGESGTWSYFLKVTTKKGSTPTESGFFIAEPSNRPGFVHVSRKDPRFFEFTNGKPYFGVGHNVCWGGARERTYDYDLYFGKMHEAGENLSRVWFCSWDMSLEGDRLDGYRLDNAWRMDYVLDLAAKYGIYVKLCLDNFHDYRDEEAIKRNPYFEASGGPIKSPEEFFSSSNAMEHYKRRLRYVVSRWGHLPAVLAWEQWNEANYALYKKVEVAAWSGEMARFLRSLDPYSHMISTTLGPDEAWKEVWELPEMDFAQMHTYIRGDERMTDRAELDAVELITKRSAEVAGFGKPFLIGEFGYAGSDKSNPLNDKDKLGVALHNAIWASAFSGAATTAANWWWDTYIQKDDLYYHYGALAKFVADLDWTGGGWELLREEDGSAVRIRGLTNGTGAYLWVQQRGNTWYNRVAEGKPVQPLRDVTLRLSNLFDGTYRVEWWNTYSGSRITYNDYPVKGGALDLSVPTAGPDVACKVKRIER